jgi:hypothetical protein
MPESKAQVRLARRAGALARLAHAVLSGGAKSSMPLDVAREIVEKMHGRKISSLPAFVPIRIGTTAGKPERVRKPKFPLKRGNR